MAADRSLWTVQTGTSNKNGGSRVPNGAKKSNSPNSCVGNRTESKDEKVYQIISKILLCDDK